MSTEPVPYEKTWENLDAVCDNFKAMLAMTSESTSPQRLYVQRFRNGTFGTKIFWSRVPGMNLVEFTQSEP